MALVMLWNLEVITHLVVLVTLLKSRNYDASSGTSDVLKPRTYNTSSSTSDALKPRSWNASSCTSDAFEIEKL